MDVYSNILYVKEDFAGLSNMAHRMTETDKYRPQSVCIVGNYYSLKGQHEKVCSACQLVCLPCASLCGHTRVLPSCACCLGNTVGGNTTCELQAVMYFRRALKLNHNYLSAWTLMGHEYVEMKNTPAAIGAPALLQIRHEGIARAVVAAKTLPIAQVNLSDHNVAWRMCWTRGIPAGSGHQPA